MHDSPDSLLLTFQVHPTLINDQFCSSSQTSTHIQLPGILREWYHLLKHSDLPRHRATAAWMGLRDLVRSKQEPFEPHPPSAPYTRVSYKKDGGGGKPYFILTATFLWASCDLLHVHFSFLKSTCLTELTACSF